IDLIAADMHDGPRKRLREKTQSALELKQIAVAHAVLLLRLEKLLNGIGHGDPEGDAVHAPHKLLDRRKQGDVAESLPAFRVFLYGRHQGDGEVLEDRD